MITGRRSNRQARGWDAWARRSLDATEARKRVVAQEHLAHQRTVLHWPPHTAVVALLAVVGQHEIVSLLDLVDQRGRTFQQFPGAGVRGVEIQDVSVSRGPSEQDSEVACRVINVAQQAEALDPDGRALDADTGGPVQ